MAERFWFGVLAVGWVGSGLWFERVALLEFDVDGKGG